MAEKYGFVDPNAAYVQVPQLAAFFNQTNAGDEYQKRCTDGSNLFFGDVSNGKGKRLKVSGTLPLKYGQTAPGQPVVQETVFR